MTRRFILGAAAACALLGSAPAPADVVSALFSQQQAQRHGLVRVWYGQVQMDVARARVQSMLLHAGTLFVQTDRAMLHAFDAETGRTLWAVQVGSPNHPSLEPGANRDLVAVVNGSSLFVLNRFNGKLLWKAQLDGGPGAGAALSDRRAYVPTVQGLMYSFALEPAKDPLEELGALRRKPSPKEENTAEAKAARADAFRLSQEYVPPLTCQSLGRSMVQAIVTRQDANQEFVAWPTDLGYLFVGLLDRRESRFTIKYRLATDNGIAAQPTYLPPDPKAAAEGGLIFAAGRDGFVHAVSEKTGEAVWRFSTGEPLVEPAVVVDELLFVATQPGGMYCVDAKSGLQKWFAPGIRQFVAASKERVYAADKLDQVQVLSAANGSRLDTIPALAVPIRLRNPENDRIYFASAQGLVQCLREVELAEPIDHGRARRPDPAKRETVQQEGLAGVEPGESKPAAKPAAKPAQPHPKAPKKPPAVKPKQKPPEEEEEKP